MQEVWIQLIITGGAVITTLFFTIRYLSRQNAKREENILKHNEKMQAMQLEYYETKNGHMERMAKDFTKASNRVSIALGKLATEIKVLSEKKK